MQGAQYVTTFSTASSPSVCVNPALNNPFLVLGLHSTLTSPGFSVGYWETRGPKPQLVRDSCSLSGYNDQVVMSDDISASGVSVTITPAIFATDAAYGWTPTTAATTVTSSVTLPNPPGSPFTLPVTSTSGLTGGSMTVGTSTGRQTVTCPAPQPPTVAFTGCTSSATGTIVQGTVMYQQQSISEISMSITEPGSAYTYSLQASPRSWASRTSGDGGQAGGAGAALVSLSDVTLSGTASLNVLGSVDIVGSLDTSNLSSGGLTATGHQSIGSPITDPLAPFLPSSATTTGGPYGSASSPCPLNPMMSPGEYQCPFELQNGDNITLRPGVYQLDSGISVAGGATLSASGGVLLYLPCTANNCSETATFASGATVDLDPLNASQALAASGGMSTALQDVWFWQASTGPGTTLIGNGSGGQTDGMAYAPMAPIDLSNSSGNDAIGGIIANGITMDGTSPGGTSLLVTGQ